MTTTIAYFEDFVMEKCNCGDVRCQSYYIPQLTDDGQFNLENAEQLCAMQMDARNWRRHLAYKYNYVITDKENA